jgi:hypothetical protein
MRNLLATFLIAVIIAATTAPTWAEMERRGNVVVFVVDSTSSILADEQKLLSQFHSFSHGDAVSELVGTEVRGIFNVDDFKGNIDKDKYYDALFLVLNQVKRIGRSKRVVVNISLGSPLPDVKEYLIIKQLYSNGAIMVAAAGNGGMKECWYPAAYDEVISVGACEGAVIADYSNNCKGIDIVANGKYTETRNQTIFLERLRERLTLHGTSFSAPRVTRVIVKMLEEKPGLNKEEIVHILQRTSTQLSFSNCNGGRVNRLKALSEISVKYRSLSRLRNWSIIAIASLSSIVVGGLFAFPLLLFLAFLFRLSLPGVWLHLKKRGIQKVMNNKEKSDKDIKYLVKCLIAQDKDLEQVARRALLDICIVSSQYRRRVRSSLESAYLYAKVNEFINEKVPIRSLLWEINFRFFQPAGTELKYAINRLFLRPK